LALVIGIARSFLSIDALAFYAQELFHDADSSHLESLLTLGIASHSVGFPQGEVVKSKTKAVATSGRWAFSIRPLA